jgi:hypothetical protein
MSCRCSTKKRACFSRVEKDKNTNIVTQESQSPPPARDAAPEESTGGLKPGQGTAIVTGAISVILGLAYIAITVALDSRGTLLPPPPEAFGP